MSLATTNDSKFGIAKWIVSPNISDGATHTTIAAALSSASSGDVIYVRPGTYTENLTLTSDYNGVTLTTYAEQGLGLLGNVKIVGKITASTVTNFVFQGFYFDDNGDNIFEDTGSATGTINFLGCQFEFGVEAIEVNNANRVLIFNGCGFSRVANSVKLFTATACNSIVFRYCISGGASFTPVASTINAGTCGIAYSRLLFNPVTTASTGILDIVDSDLSCVGYDITAITTAGTATSTVNGIKIRSGTASGISVGSGTTLVLDNAMIFSTNANPITGAGTIRYGAVDFLESGNGINVTTQQTAVTRAHQIAVKTGATIDEFSTDGTLAGNSDTAVPTEKAVKTYVDASAGGGGSSVSNYVLWDDFTNFFATATGTGTFVSQFFAGGASGTGARVEMALLSITGVDGNPGIINFQTGSTTTGSASIFNNQKSTFGNGSYECEFRLKIEDLSTSSQRFTLYIGFGTSFTTEPTDGAYFVYSDNINSGNWQAKTASSSSRTTANSSTAVVADAWIKLKIVVNAAGTSVSFYVDGVEIANSPITTNIPTSTFFDLGMGVVKSVGSTNRFIYLDYVSENIELTTPR